MTSNVIRAIMISGGNNKMVKKIGIYLIGMGVLMLLVAEMSWLFIPILALWTAVAIIDVLFAILLAKKK